MLQRIVLVLGAVISAYISVKALVSPETVMSDFGLPVEGADGRNEIRAQYGGFFGAVALTMACVLPAYCRAGSGWAYC